MTTSREVQKQCGIKIGLPVILVDEKGRVMCAKVHDGETLEGMLDFMLNASDEAKKARLAKELTRAAPAPGGTEKNEQANPAGGENPEGAENKEVESEDSR